MEFAIDKIKQEKFKNEVFSVGNMKTRDKTWRWIKQLNYMKTRDKTSKLYEKQEVCTFCRKHENAG